MVESRSCAASIRQCRAESEGGRQRRGIAVRLHAVVAGAVGSSRLRAYELQRLAVASVHARYNDDAYYYDVRVINGFSNNSSAPLVVWCVSRETGDIGGRALQERDDYSWDVEPSAFWTRDHEFVCTVKWDRTRKSFKAFDGSRDRYKCGPRRLCLWMVKEDGFYFSNDGIRWIKDFPWM
ncbi:Plant self-incompatibility protein S1 family [Striga hermonthica]|uniref:Plant self-incompatibility protein S1 family n=1 Tax=Striga hermonthica TaxID=68872 RepID=A0A9N7MQI8_STRHE|nr:Plant self-incompatibility protein S1 family [Striga hermonthica]